MMKLQEIVWGATCDHRLSIPWSRVELEEGVFHVFVNLHDRGLVATSVTIVRGREDCDDILLLRPVVSLHDKLMCSRNQSKAIVMVECFRDVLSKGVTCTSRRDSPSTSIIRIGPEKVTHWTLVWHLLDSVQRANVIESVDRRT